VRVVKLDGRHNLKGKGYAWAFRFDGYETRAGKVDRLVSNFEGWRYNNTHWGKREGRGSRPYWIGFNKESTISMVLLSLKD
jgi:hypothetical protein